MNDMKYILASASPRRRKLLAQMGLSFEVIPAKGEELISSTEPKQVVMELAAQKAAEVAERYEKQSDPKQVTEDCMIIGADTVVVHKGEILGKPKDAADAVRMLESLSGDVHLVYTGVSLVVFQGGEKYTHTFFEATDVRMHEMTGDEIYAYVDTGEPLDKAGSYGIQGQGGMFIDRIDGDYNNVVGLPIARLYQEMKVFAGFH